MRRILFAMIGAVALTAFIAAPASAGKGFVNVDPTSGAPGDPITVSGNCGVADSGFKVEIVFLQSSLSELLGTTETAADGTFSINAVVPAGAQPGGAEIQAQCFVDSTSPLTTDFTVTPRPPTPEPPASTAAEPVTGAPVFTG